MNACKDFSICFTNQIDAPAAAAEASIFFPTDFKTSARSVELAAIIRGSSVAKVNAVAAKIPYISLIERTGALDGGEMIAGSFEMIESLLVAATIAALAVR